MTFFLIAFAVFIFLAFNFKYVFIIAGSLLFSVGAVIVSLVFGVMFGLITENKSAFPADGSIGLEPWAWAVFIVSFAFCFFGTKGVMESEGF